LLLILLIIREDILIVLIIRTCKNSNSRKSRKGRKSPKKHKSKREDEWGNIIDDGPGSASRLPFL
jgi:hypothetical protein